jgi:predicted lipoprotein with Yx(FWY)xxD motif
MDQQEKQTEDFDQVNDSEYDVSQEEENGDKKLSSILPLALLLLVIGLVIFTYFGFIQNQTNSLTDEATGPDPEAIQATDEQVTYELQEDEIEIVGRLVDLDNNVLSVMNFNHLGYYLVDGADFLTLYEEREEGQCVGECQERMVPYTSESEYEVPVGVSKNFIETTFDEETGLYQYSWNGKKLYHFEDDLTVESVLGDGLNNAWTLARP